MSARGLGAPRHRRGLLLLEGPPARSIVAVATPVAASR